MATGMAAFEWITSWIWPSPVIVIRHRRNGLQPSSGRITETIVILFQICVKGNVGEAIDFWFAPTKWPNPNETLMTQMWSEVKQALTGLRFACGSTSHSVNGEGILSLGC